jgi:hypothetical protein
MAGDVHEVKHVVSPDRGEHQTDWRRAASIGSQNNAVSGTKPISPAAMNSSEHSEKPEISDVRSKLSSPSFNGIGQPHSIRPVEAAPKVAAQNNRANGTLPLSPIQPAGALLNDVHIHGPAPSAVGGPVGSRVNSTGAINGTTVNHKP